jgi:dsDNA-specific endonuclease/ATPase MutS2
MQIEGVIALLIPIFGLSIPIVAILTKHQKDMAQTFAQQHQLQTHGSPELMQMREEMRLLREQLNQQSILLDDIRTQSKNLQERVSENA